MIVLTIKRPDGRIEKVQRDGGMTKVMFSKIQEATRNAGRGEILGWELVDDRTEEEKQATISYNEINKIEHEMARCRDYDNKRYIALRKELEALKAK